MCNIAGSMKSTDNGAVLSLSHSAQQQRDVGILCPVCSYIACIC